MENKTNYTVDDWFDLIKELRQNGFVPKKEVPEEEQRVLLQQSKDADPEGFNAACLDLINLINTVKEINDEFITVIKKRKEELCLL